MRAAHRPILRGLGAGSCTRTSANSADSPGLRHIQRRRHRLRRRRHRLHRRRIVVQRRGSGAGTTQVSTSRADVCATAAARFFRRALLRRHDVVVLVVGGLGMRRHSRNRNRQDQQTDERNSVPHLRSNKDAAAAPLLLLRRVLDRIVALGIEPEQVPRSAACAAATARTRRSCRRADAARRCGGPADAACPACRRATASFPC